ncbi:MAG: FAD-dependent oxidoreductase [Peptococcaceae bacterium]|nr:FAD-dependent oxidoreductase [Peptococcaceae bacterium]
MIEHLLKEGKVGSLKLNNRVIYSAMSFDLSHHNGFLTESEIKSLVYRAKQEYAPGLISFPSMGTAAPSKVGMNDMATIFDETSMLMAKKAVQEVKKYGVKVMVQCGGGYENPGFGPSDRTTTNTGQSIKAMTISQIEEYIDSVGKAAKLRVAAGFDAIEIHACTGKFLSTFLSPYTNQREDKYGGCIENRARIVIEVLKEVRNVIGKDFPIFIRLSVDDLIGDRGLQIEDGIRIAQLIAPYVDAIQPSVGLNEFKWTISPSYFFKQGYVLPFTEKIKSSLNADTAVIAMGKLGNPNLADRIVAHGSADFICLGRPLFVDPQWMTKAAKNQNDRILKCIGCVNCFLTNHREIFPPHRACTLNPANLREDQFYHLEPADNKKNILVIGGGLAGIEAAITLSERGHNVTLCEKHDKLGGQWLIASHGEEKGDYRTLLPYKMAQLKKNGVTINLKTTVDKKFLDQHTYDCAVLATGATPKMLPYAEDLLEIKVVQGNDVIMDNVETGDRVVVIGGRFIGMEVAVKLAKGGKDVSIVDMQEIGANANPRIAGILRNQMVKYDVKMYPNCPVRKIDDFGVEITHMHLPLLLEADTVVLAIGTSSNDGLKKVLDEKNLVYYAIGDCRQVGDALTAIRDGAEIGRLL